MTSSEGFQQHFSIISKDVVVVFNMKKNAAFKLIYFAVLIWDDCLSVQLQFELLVQVPVGTSSVASRARTKQLVQNVIELEFEQSRM